MALRVEDLLEEALNEPDEDVADAEVISFSGGWILGAGYY